MFPLMSTPQVLIDPWNDSIDGIALTLKQKLK